ncbi:MAG: glycerophosphodiester phosphodiesterase [Vicinamibacterales bacterium]
MSDVSHPVLDRTRRLVFAHRGGSALGPENTLAAFDHGLACGADGFELDVHLAADGVPVVIHDAVLDRTTDASGPVGERTSAELAAVDAGARFLVDGRQPFRGQGIGVPTLCDVLARYPGVPLIIELKGRSPVLARRVLQDVRAAGATGRVCFGGFSNDTLDAIRPEAGVVTSASRWETRLALYTSWVGLSPTRRYRAFQVPETKEGHRVVSERFVRLAHRDAVVVQVWTVNEVDDMRRLLTWGVDALITDRPDRAVDVVRAWNQAAR